MTQAVKSALADAAYYAHTHVDQPLKLDTLASVAGLLAHRFHRRFRQAFRETPAAYVRRLRLERAAWRLLLLSDSILAIALDCGFNDHETFSRAFRRHYGLSPHPIGCASMPPWLSRQVWPATVASESLSSRHGAAL